MIEHLEDPIGAMLNTIRAIKDGGSIIMAVPDMRLTFDRDRPETTAQHLFCDLIDGGESTRRQAFRDTSHMRIRS